MSTPTRPRIGPRMHQVYAYVLENPGTTKFGAAWHAAPRSPGGQPGIGYGYRSVDRALAVGIITSRLHGRIYELHANPVRYEELTRDE